MSLVPDVDFAFQPIYSLHTGAMIAVEAVARPLGRSTRQLLGRARHEGRLVETDIALAADAVHSEADRQTLLSLHLNLFATSVASGDDAFAPLLEALAAAARRPRDVVIEVGPPFSHAEPAKLMDGVQRLQRIGFRVALDGLGVGDLPLGLLACAAADVLKVDRSVLRQLPADPGAVAVVEALLHVCSRSDARLIATGIETADEFRAARELGVRFVQGDYFAPADHDIPLTTVPAYVDASPRSRDSSVVTSIGTPTIIDFIRPPATLPANITCDAARSTLADCDQTTAIVGIDADGRPRWTIDRSRFLLALSGRYGHALHANQPAERFTDAPNIIHSHAGALEVLEMVADTTADRMNDDIVVVDTDGVCLGIVRVAEVVRGVAEAKIEEAASLNPLTKLPSTVTIAKEVDRRIQAGEPFIAAWLDVDDFKVVNDTLGFAAGDELIRSLGRTLTELSSSLARMTVSHVGGDDFLIASDTHEIATLAPALLDTPWRAQHLKVSVSMAGLVCLPGTVASYEEVSQLLAPLKHKAKNVPGSTWVLGRPGIERVDVLRGRSAMAQRPGLSA